MSIEFQTRVTFHRVELGWLRSEAAEQRMLTNNGDPAIVEVGSGGGKFVLRCFGGRSMEVKPGDYVMFFGLDAIGISTMGFFSEDEPDSFLAGH